MRLYYSDELCSIYHGDCRELLLLLGLLDERVDLLLADPPYGQRLRTDNATRSNKATSKDYTPVAGDDRPFDPRHLLALRCPTILWGANFYADKLPVSASWIVWDKVDGLTSRREIGFNDNADCELAWSNLGGVARTCSLRWMGTMRSTQQQQRRVHPTEKPVALFQWCATRAGLRPGQLVVDPYMGSGSCARACKNMGLRYIGVELVEAYCAHAAQQLRQEAMQLEVA